jgi:DNA polymerase-1
VFVDADYSQAELRILSMYSKDERLLRAYRDDEDIHTITAARMFNVPMGKVTKLQRTMAKPVNFGIAYGLQAYKLAKQLERDEDEAQGFIDAFFAEFRGVERWIDRVKEKAHAEGYVRSVFGRVRRLPLLDHDNERIRAEAERQAVNALIQGTASDCLLVSLWRLHNRLRREKLYTAHIVLTVHDCTIVECDEKDAKRVAACVKEEMERPIKGITVAMPTDVEICRQWGEGNDSLGVVWSDAKKVVREAVRVT